MRVLIILTVVCLAGCQSRTLQQQTDVHFPDECAELPVDPGPASVPDNAAWFVIGPDDE